MNFVLIENANGNVSVVWENNFVNLPSDAVAFTYYQHGNIDENGMVNSFEYRIGIPVKFVIGDMYIELESNIDDTQKDDIYCLYLQNGNRIFKPINKNTILLNNFSELKVAYNSIIKKETSRRR